MLTLTFELKKMLLNIVAIIACIKDKKWKFIFSSQYRYVPTYKKHIYQLKTTFSPNL